MNRAGLSEEERKLTNYIDDHLVCDRYDNGKKFTGDDTKVRKLVKLLYSKHALDRTYSLTDYLKAPKINLRNDLEGASLHLLMGTNDHIEIKHDLKKINRIKRKITDSHIKNKTNIVKDFRLITKSLCNYQLLKGIFYNQMLLDDVSDFTYVDALNNKTKHANDILYSFFSDVSDPHYSALARISMGVDDLWYYGSKISLKIYDAKKKKMQKRIGEKYFKH